MSCRRALSVADDISTLARSPLFDRRWYEICYPEACHGQGEPLVYFCDRGWRKGQAPNPYFDVSFYLKRNPDVQDLGINPLIHYLRYGEAEKRWPSLHFDPEWYRVQNGLAAEDHCLSHLMSETATRERAPNPGFDPEWYCKAYGSLIPPGLSAFADYRLRGVAEDRHPSLAHREIAGSKLFDSGFYCGTNPSIAESGLEPLYHFCAIGWREGLRPGPAFDSAVYEANNPDVREAGLNPLIHYLRFGAVEGRLPRPDKPLEGATLFSPSSTFSMDDDVLAVGRSGLFEPDYYLANSPDVRATGRDTVEHFCRFGWREGRRPNPYFDPAWYDALYLEGRQEQNPLCHYIETGEKQGFKPIIYFETEWYRSAYNLDGKLSPLRHFLMHRRSQSFSPTRHFDISFYMAIYGDAVGRNRDPFAHFLRTAITHNVKPNLGFNVEEYRTKQLGEPPPREPVAPGGEVHKRLERERLNPLVHFLLQAAAHEPVARE